MRTLRRQPGACNVESSTSSEMPSPVMNQMYEDITLPQPVLQVTSPLAKHTTSFSQNHNHPQHNPVGGMTSLPFMGGEPYDNVVVRKAPMRGGASTLPGYY